MKNFTTEGKWSSVKVSDVYTFRNHSREVDLIVPTAYNPKRR